MRFLAPVLLLFAVLFYVLNKNYPHILEDHQNYLSILQIALVLSLILLSVVRKRIDLNLVLKNTAIWLGLALILVSGYSYRYSLKSYYQNILGNIIPSMAVQQEDGSVTFQAGDGGHFKIQANINGQNIQFLLDTGATKVALTANDARRIGFNVDALQYDVRINTANGIALFASVTIPEIAVGTISVKDVGAYVAQSGLDNSLLGMSFLSKLKEYEVTQDTLTLRR